MATLILVRHGRSTANTSGVLAGRTPGVQLDDKGREQVEAVARRLAGVRLASVRSSPVHRCQQTATAIVAAHSELELVLDEGLSECDYGDWQGRTIKELAELDLWKVVQRQPSRVTFPGGESMVAMHSRVVQALRETDAAIEAEHGPEAVWVAVSHGDPIKVAIADALGLHLDQFQRIGVDPASVSVIRYTADRPYLMTSNTHAGDLSWLSAPSPKEPVVGGGAGPESPEDSARTAAHA